MTDGLTIPTYSKHADYADLQWTVVLYRINQSYQFNLRTIILKRQNLKRQFDQSVKIRFLHYFSIIILPLSLYDPLLSL
jgi:hypothetical protein